MADDAKTRIELRPDGPILVKNLEVLIGPDGSTLETKEVIALCRCGASKNKPFCDGTHKDVGFRSEESTSRTSKKERDYEGAGIVVHDNREICSHAAECVRGLPNVFRPGERPWIQPDAATAEELIAVIRRCPTGALSYTQTETAPKDPAAAPRVRDFALEPAIAIAKDGPLNVQGGIEIDVEDERRPPTVDHYSLCRCGASKNKPYCDGSHAEVDFTD